MNTWASTGSTRLSSKRADVPGHAGDDQEARHEQAESIDRGARRALLAAGSPDAPG
jgi:hypothetical protein